MAELENRVAQLEYTMANHQHENIDGTKELPSTAASPGGNDTEFQYNNNGVFAGTSFSGVSALTFDNVTGTITINGDGGDALIQAKSAEVSSSNDASNVTLAGGDGDTSGDGGDVTLKGGSGGLGESNSKIIARGADGGSVNGADIDINGGFAVSAGSGNGGNVNLAGGSKDGTGHRGVIKVTGQYYSVEYDNGNITGTATIDWTNSNVQYATMTGNVTLTFSQPKGGGRYILQLAGAFTPTFPASIRWSAGVTPTPTVSAGHKDIYTFIYSGKESLYDGLQSPNYAIT